MMALFANADTLVATLDDKQVEGITTNIDKQQIVDTSICKSYDIKKSCSMELQQHDTHFTVFKSPTSVLVLNKEYYDLPVVGNKYKILCNICYKGEHIFVSDLPVSAWVSLYLVSSNVYQEGNNIWESNLLLQLQ